MFGHNDQHHNDSNQPAPDGALAHDQTAPQVDDTAGDYLDDVSPATTVAPSAHDEAVLPDTGTTDDSDSVSSADTASAPSTPTPAATASPNTDQLLDIKQQALQQLTPLVGHLDQSAEEKFRTTMMMIQASDNHELVQTAYEAAQQITDEKVRAQALLDIVNEINYFTHNGSSDAQ